MLKLIQKLFPQKKQKPLSNAADGRCVMLLPNLLYHAKLKAEGKVKDDFQTWTKETYGDVKFM